VGIAYGQSTGGQAPGGPAPSAAASQSPTPDKIVVKVGDESITQGEIERFIQGLAPQDQKTLASRGRRALGDEFVLMLVLSQESVSHHLDSTPAYREMLALRRRQLLASLMYQEILRESVVTPEETSKYYAAHQSDFGEAQIQQVVIRTKPEGAKEGTPGFTAEEAKTRAEEIRKALSSSDDAKKIAEKYQVPNVIRVDAEPFSVRRGSMRPDMQKAAFELKDGQVSEVFELGPSLVFFKVISHRVPELKDVSSQIENNLRQQKVNSTLDGLKKNANVWMDESYFAAPAPAGQPGTVNVPAPAAPPPAPK